MAKDPYRYFRIEAGELLDQLAKAVLLLEKQGGIEQVMSLLRLAHTLKGAARVVRQADIADLSHTIEDLLAPYRSGNASDKEEGKETAVPRACIDNILSAIDAIAAKIAQLPRPDDAPQAQTAASNTDTTPQALMPEPTVRVVRSDIAGVDNLLEGLGEIGNELAGVKRNLSVVERVRDLAVQMSQKSSLSAMRVKLMLEEMQTLAITAERGMSASVERIDRELRDARDAAERLRLVPVSSIFNALERTARDGAHATGKQVIFEAKGSDVRIEAEVLDTVQSALIQLVRNAVAHGIESSERRKQAGKAAAGRITLEVVRRGYRAWFCCRDDGGGIDLDGVRRALQKRGVTSAETQRMDAQQLMAALLKGGISTSNTVTELSGRGVGLDLVREAMQRLNGEVTTHTVAGKSTQIELLVPLSLAALDVLLVESGTHIVALPMDAVRRTLRIGAQDISRSSAGDVIIHNEKPIPLTQLQLGQQAEHRKKHFALGAQGEKALTAVIIEAENTQLALAVDRLRGLETVVLQPLPALAPADAIVLGVYLGNEGNPRMILDPEHLILRQQQRGTGDTSDAAATELRPILIIDDSLTTRMLESSILESAGYQVELAACAEDGMEMARKKSYALFLVDVEMPGMDGFTFVERTRADPALREVPCILVTSRDEPDDRKRGMNAGASAYIVKGEFDQPVFLQRVTELVWR
jgi:two-component system chemotaxis sensor kinase CheA